MATTALLTEFLISGLIILMTIFFAVLSILGVYNLKFLVELKELSAVIILLVSVFSYLLGGLLQILIAPRTIARTLSQVQLLKRTLKAEEDWTIEHGEAFYLVLQYGSQHLVNRVQYKQSMNRLVAATAITLPFLGISLTAWIFTGFGWRLGLISTILFVLIWVVTTIASIRVNTSFNRVVRYASQALRAKI